MDEVEDGEILDGQEGQYSQISQTSDEGGDEGRKNNSCRTQRRKKRKARHRHPSVHDLKGQDDDEEDDRNYIEEARRRRRKHVDHLVYRSKCNISSYSSYQRRPSRNHQVGRYLSDHGRYSDKSSGIRRNSDGVDRSRNEKRRHFSVEERPHRHRSYSSGSHSASLTATSRSQKTHANEALNNGVPVEKKGKTKKRNLHGSNNDSTFSGLPVVVSPMSSSRRERRKQTKRKEDSNLESANKDKSGLKNSNIISSEASTSEVFNNDSSVQSVDPQVEFVEQDEVIILPIEPKDVPLIDLVSDVEEEESRSSSRDDVRLSDSESQGDDAETLTDSAHESWAHKEDDQQLLNDDDGDESQTISNHENHFIPTFQEIPPENNVQCVPGDNAAVVNEILEPTEDESELMELELLELRRAALEGLLIRVTDGKIATSTAAGYEKSLYKNIEVDKLREVVRRVAAERKNRSCNDTGSDQLGPIAPSQTNNSNTTSVVEGLSEQNLSTTLVQQGTGDPTVSVITDSVEPRGLANLPPPPPIPENDAYEENEEELELILLRQKLLMDMKKKHGNKESGSAPNISQSVKSLVDNQTICIPNTQPVRSTTPVLVTTTNSSSSVQLLSNDDLRLNLISKNSASKQPQQSNLEADSLLLHKSQNAPQSPSHVETTAVTNSTTLQSLNAATVQKPLVPALKRSVQVLDSTLALNVNSSFEQTRYSKRRKINKKSNDPYSIKRTVVNNLATSPYNTPLKLDHRLLRNNSAVGSRQERIVISVRPDETSDDDDEVSDAEIPVVQFENPIEVTAETTHAVQLPQSFHTSLDSFLKSVRESASRSHLSSESTASVDINEANQESVQLPSPDVLTSPATSMNSPKPSKACDTVEEIRRCQSEWLEVESVATTEDDLSETEHENVVDGEKSAAGSNPRIARFEEEPLNKKTNQGSSDSTSLSPIAKVADVLQPVTAVIDEPSSPSLPTCTLTASNSNPDKPEQTPLLSSKTEGIAVACDAEEPLLKPRRRIKRKAKAKLKLKPSLDNTLKSIGDQIPTDAVAAPTPSEASPKKALDAAQLKQQEIQTRAELKLREKLLRAALQRNEERLKLSGKENELIKFREKVNGLMGEALLRINNHGEKKKRCQVLERKVEDIRKQLLMAEKALGKAQAQCIEDQRTVFSSIDEAFRMRSVAAKLSLECRNLGIRAVGDKYMLPKTGAKDLTDKIKAIYSKSTKGKDLDASKGLKLASKEIFQAWQIEKTDKELQTDSNNTSINNDDEVNPVAEQAGSFRLTKFILEYDKKKRIAVSPKFHPYQSVLRPRRLGNGWKNDSIVCKFLSSKIQPVVGGWYKPNSCRTSDENNDIGHGRNYIFHAIRRREMAKIENTLHFPFLINTQIVNFVNSDKQVIKLTGITQTKIVHRLLINSGDVTIEDLFIFVYDNR